MTPFFVSIAVASIDRDAGTVLTIDGQTLPVTAWADRGGVVDVDPADAAVCSAGPDARGGHWTVDIDKLLARVLQ